jgi:predicted nucleic acid-binding Zn ribbon protein
VRLAQADRLARATGMDMVAAGWKPTVGNYLGRVTKPASSKPSVRAPASGPPSSSTI